MVEHKLPVQELFKTIFYAIRAVFLFCFAIIPLYMNLTIIFLVLIRHVPHDINDVAIEKTIQKRLSRTRKCNTIRKLVASR